MHLNRPSLEHFRRTFTICVAFLLPLLFTDFLSAQRTSPTRIGRNSTQMKQTLESLVDPIEKSICEIKDGKESVAMGTIVSANGLIVTKLSEIQEVENLTCKLADDQEKPAKIVAELEDYDLVLLKIDAENLSPIDLPDSELEITAGRIVLSADANGNLISMGITSVAPRRFEMRQPRASSNRGFLGIDCSPVDQGLEIGRITPRSAAQKAGLKRSDILVEFEGSKVPSVSSLIALLEDHAPEDEVSVLIQREEKTMEKTIQLGSMPAGSAAQDRWGGGPFSERRFGFPVVIAHDCAIRPSDCGGPLVDSDGKVIGINIARALRISTYAVPIHEVKKFVAANQ